eukprot:TRINITY_DN54744_c0_g1_i1.p1 TRINITY_DN54744_c0_g1~~TRINITY_DN54744_c0_g1_i1.p1  ORF type:complete len:734 (+),score=130.03 TRINITY_DN54744_c0_g1_i1:49-2250(+)
MLSDTQRRTLVALCDAFVPALESKETADVVAAQARARRAAGVDDASAKVEAFCRCSASDLGVADFVERNIDKHLPADAARDVRLLLSALSSRIGMVALCGTFTPFADLDRAGREAALLALCNSRFATKRKAYLGLKGLVLVKAFGQGSVSSSGQLQNNSTWAALGYAGPESAERAAAETEKAGRPEHEFDMMNAEIKGDSLLECDVVIVGSGCGGAVVAAELAAAGHRVIVLEKGQYYPRRKFSGIEGDALDRLYERGGLVSTEDSGIAVMAGATFGGGTTVNWACCLRTPDEVRREWAEKYGLTRFVSDDFTRSLDVVSERISVKSEGVAHNRNNQLLMEGCKRLGYDIAVTGQNMADVSANAAGANSIQLGDRYGLKQSATETFLKDAAMASVPARFVDQCHVLKVQHRLGKVAGVVGSVIGADGCAHRLEVRAPLVVVAGGAINSPALLLRSGLPNRNGKIGKNLRLHPVSGVLARMPEGVPDVNAWNGAPMTTVSTVCASGLDGDYYGSRLECPAVTPGVISTGMPWKGGRAFKEFILDMRRYTYTIILTRDRGSGEVRIDKDGQARLYYPLDAHDERSMLEGVDKAIRIAAAAGAESVITPQLSFDEMRRLAPEADPKARAESVDRVIADVRAQGFPSNKSVMFSAHQMGTCQMGASPHSSVVDDEGQCWEVSGLYVADASVFPSSSGTNPMVTTLAIAHSIAQGLKRRLASAPAPSSSAVVAPRSRL